MANEAQKKWMQDKVDFLEKKVRSKGVFNMTHDDWEDVTKYMKACIEKAGPLGKEMQKMLFECVEVFEREQREKG